MITQGHFRQISRALVSSISFAVRELQHNNLTGEIENELDNPTIR